MSMQANPLHWSNDVKALTSLITLIATIVTTVGGASIYLGEKIYNFAEAQEAMIQELQHVQTGLTEAKTSVEKENALREASLTGLKVEIVPRIDKLEDAVHKAETEAAAARTRAEDMQADLKGIKDLAQRNLTVTESHDADIKATRNAVAPKDGPP